MPKTYKIGVVEDHELLRKAFAALIRDSDEFTISIEAENGLDLIKKVTKMQAADIPDVLIIDVNMPNMNGFETVAWVKSHLSETKILIMSVMEDENVVVRLLRMGVNGYITKHSAVEEIHLAIHNIIKKGFHYSEFIAGRLLQSLRREMNIMDQTVSAANAAWETLNDNEKRLAQLSCSEYTYAEIADLMGLSSKTIEGFRSNVFSKCNVKTRVGLVMLLLRNKLVE